MTETPFTVRSAGEEPFALSQFLLSNRYFDALSRPGDPTMMLLTSTEQFQDRYVFLMPQGYSTNVVTIVAPMGETITLDTVPLSASASPVGTLHGQEYGYLHASVGAGAHVIEGGQPFGIIVSGHASDVSYGYVGGSGVAKISEPPPPPG